jgi:hypothetical protein
VQMYSTLDSYQDSGTVSRVIDDDRNDAPYRIDFTTAYQSPSLFRFAFSLPHPFAPLSHIVTNYIVGFDGSNAYFVTKASDRKPDLKTADTLNSAIARATGISSGSAHTISRLLLRDISGLSILDLVEARLLPDATVSNTECYSVSAQHPRGGEWLLSVEKKTLLLRKLRVSLGAQPGVLSEEIRDSIRVNQPIDASVFSTTT